MATPVRRDPVRRLYEITNRQVQISGYSLSGEPGPPLFHPFSDARNTADIDQVRVLEQKRDIGTPSLPLKLSFLAAVSACLGASSLAVQH